jgi:methanogenic corrinoid protein MtbC1
MDELKHHVDIEAVTRTATLFAVKREKLPADTIANLARTIVGQIAEKAKKDAPSKEHAVNQDSLENFCTCLLNPSPDAAISFIKERLAEGVGRQKVYLGYIGAAAERLGKGWDEDRLSFVDVAIGTGHLYALMRAIRLKQVQSHEGFVLDKSALFAAVPGETHGVGISMAANIFRDADWDIDLQLGTEHDTLVAHIEASQPKIIGLSLSSERSFEALVRLVIAIRIVAPEAILGVATGGKLEKDKVRGLVDIDLLFEDANTALDDMNALITRRSQLG